MKIGLIGLPQTGKKTLFSLLTQYTFSEKDLVANKNIKSLFQIKDPRFDHLVSAYKPKKEARGRVDIELLPDIGSDSVKNSDILKDISEFDAICHIVRAFNDDSIYHINGSVDFKRDIDNINSEFILHDLLFIEKRLERIETNLKKANAGEELKEKELLLKLKTQLDKELPLRLIDLTTQEIKIIASYPFVTAKKLIIVLNISENELSNIENLKKLEQEYQALDIYILQICAKVESEISELETKQEKEEFLAALGIKEPAIDALTRTCIKAIDLISFFTVGSDEVRQWLVKANSSAPEAAGVIHSDLQKGFIRAEVMKYADFLALGSEDKLRQEGKVTLKGKDYIVEDGDIINIKFNV
ncbi:DUF933 domain-containing protein [bacterium]|nr:DUF933 domain-containing protein [bacterium]